MDGDSCFKLIARVLQEIAGEEEQMADGRQVYREAFCAGLRPDPRLTVSEWADQHRWLPQRAAAEPGPWRTSRTPYLREIMDRLSPSDPAEIVILMKGAQIGGTEAGNNWLGFIMDHAPGPTMMVQPVLEMAKRVSKQRIAPMIEDCPRLRTKVRDPRSRDSGNTILIKEFPGGVLVMTGANSAVGLRSMPVRNLFLDEVDGYEADVDGEGNPVDLALKRTATFRHNRKIFICSTPTIRDISNIERAFKRSDQRRFHVPCPYCGNLAPIEWGNLLKVAQHEGPDRWEPAHPDEMGLLCGACGRLIPEHRKTEMLERGRWIATGAGEPGIVGYHLSSLYSPAGWYSWSEALGELRLAKERGQETLKTWVNTVLGETWDDQGETVDTTGLMARREHYGAQLPEPVLVLTAGVDVQENRLEMEVVGWCAGEESWSIDYQVLFGDPDSESVWARLDDILTRSWQCADGRLLRIPCTFIDSQYRSKAVFAYAKTRRALGVYSSGGVGGEGKPIVSAPKPQRYGHSQRPVPKFMVGTFEAKSLLYARLRLTEHGPGYCHFPLREPYNDRYFLQLTAEKRITKFHKGFPKVEWVKIRERNEALDCRILAHAALCLLNPAWSALRRRADKQAGEGQAQAPPPAATPESMSEDGAQTAADGTGEGLVETPAQADKDRYRPFQNSRRKRRGFVNRWRE